MEPSSPLSSTNHRSLARFRSEVRPKIRKLPFAGAYLWICARRKIVQDDTRLGMVRNKHPDEEQMRPSLSSIPNQIATLIEMCRIASDRCRAF